MKKIISPHVNIYKFPITAISSIATRLSGLYLTGLFIGVGINQFDNNKLLFNYYKNLNNTSKEVINYSLILPSVYHTYGGLRHFIWDKYPSLLTNKLVARSSLGIFGITFVTSYYVNSNCKNIITKFI